MNLLLEDISVMELTNNWLPFLRYACYIILIGFTVFIVYKRLANKIITYQEVLDWAKTVCVSGDICHISRISDIPEEVQNQIRKELGAQQIINGYRNEGSVLVTITDSHNNIKETSYFMGKELDKELSNALAVEIEHRITF